MKEFNNFTASNFDNAVFHLMNVQAFDAVNAILKEITVPMAIERDDKIYVTDQYVIIQTMGSAKAKLYKAKELLDALGSVELIKEILAFESKMKQIKGENADLRTEFYAIAYGVKPLLEGELETLVEGFVKS